MRLRETLLTKQSFPFRFSAKIPKLLAWEQGRLRERRTLQSHVNCRRLRNTNGVRLWFSCVWPNDFLDFEAKQ